MSYNREVYRLSVNPKDFENPGSFSDVYIKRYRFVNLKQIVQTLLHVHKAQKSWRIGRILLQKGIPTPKPIAYLARRTSRLAGEHLLITEGITHGISLFDYVHEHFHPHTITLSEKRLLIKNVAEFLGKLHLAGIYHGDLTAHNIFVEHARPNQFRISLIDLDSVRSTHWISFRRRIKNLDELGRNFLDLRVISTSDRIRFLKHYLQTYTKESLNYKQLFACVLQRTRKRLKKHHTQFICSAHYEF